MKRPNENQRQFCQNRSCGCSLTSTDISVGYCTQCFTPTKDTTREQTSYNGMKHRCLNKNAKRYSRYGGRGITVCDRWLQSFKNFYVDMGPRPEGTTLERRDNDGNYEPNNCCWATPREQSNNMRRNKHIEFNGKRKTIAQWSRETGLKPVTIRTRLRRGWAIRQVFNLGYGKNDVPSRFCVKLSEPQPDSLEFTLRASLRRVREGKGSNGTANELCAR